MLDTPLAMADRNQPGILEAQRKQAGMTIRATLFVVSTPVGKKRARVAPSTRLIGASSL
jgi:hypothetical protein